MEFILIASIGTFITLYLREPKALLHGYYRALEDEFTQPEHDKTGQLVENSQIWVYKLLGGCTVCFSMQLAYWLYPILIAAWGNVFADIIIVSCFILFLQLARFIKSQLVCTCIFALYGFVTLVGMMLLNMNLIAWVAHILATGFVAALMEKWYKR